MVAVTSIMRVHQILMARLNELLEPFELTFPRYEALMLLHFCRRGSLPLGKIGERLQVHRTSVTNTIDGLEKLGLVRRVPHETDRRAVLAEILPSGPRGRRGGDRGAERGRLRHRAARRRGPRGAVRDACASCARGRRLRRLSPERHPGSASGCASRRYVVFLLSVSRLFQTGGESRGDATAARAALGEGADELPLRFVTAASLFDGHDAAINVMRRLIQAPGPR